jgi:hypothetical protein
MYNPLRGALLDFFWRRKNNEHCDFKSGMYFIRKFETPIVPSPSGRCITI